MPIAGDVVECLDFSDRGNKLSADVKQLVEADVTCRLRRKPHSLRSCERLPVAGECLQAVVKGIGHRLRPLALVRAQPYFVFEIGTVGAAVLSGQIRKRTDLHDGAQVYGERRSCRSNT